MTKSSINKLLALVLLFLAGFAAWYWMQEKKIEREGKNIFKTSLQSVHSIRLEVNGRPKIKLEKRDSRWYVVSPVEDLADESNVAKLLTFAQKVEKDRVITPDARNLDTFGLSSPEALLTFETDSGSQELRYGHKTIDEKKVFACLRGKNEVFILLTENLENLFPQLFQLREKRFLLMDKKKIDTLTIDFEGSSVRLQKRKSGWSQKAGSSRPELVQKANEVIDDLSRIVIFDFVQEVKGANQGLNPPRFWFEVHDSDNSQQKFLFGNEGPEGFIYAKTSGRPGVLLVDKPRIWNLFQK